MIHDFKCYTPFVVIKNIDLVSHVAQYSLVMVYTFVSDSLLPITDPLLPIIDPLLFPLPTGNH